MKCIHQFFTIILLIIIGQSYASGQMAIFTSNKSWDANFLILPDSKLYLEGRSNVNKFSCDCLQEYDPIEVLFSVDTHSKSAIFTQTQLYIQTALLDCGSKGINKDLRATLQEDRYPFIEIQLDKVELNRRQNEIGTQWTHLIAHTQLSIAGQTQAIKMPILARSLSGETYQFKSFYQLTLSSFGIEPPTAFLGLIKVKDEIVIHFDLHIKAGGTK